MATLEETISRAFTIDEDLKKLWLPVNPFSRRPATLVSPGVDMRAIQQLTALELVGAYIGEPSELRHRLQQFLAPLRYRFLQALDETGVATFEMAQRKKLLNKERNYDQERQKNHSRLHSAVSTHETDQTITYLIGQAVAEILNDDGASVRKTIANPTWIKRAVMRAPDLLDVAPRGRGAISAAWTETAPVRHIATAVYHYWGRTMDDSMPPFFTYADRTLKRMQARKLERSPSSSTLAPADTLKIEFI